MKLSELKADVYRLAEVSTTEQLKAKYAEIKSLDLRYKASWQKALGQLQQLLKTKKASMLPADTASSGATSTDEATSTDTDPTEFKDWLDNPPAEYKELFAEAGAALASFGQKLDQTKKLTRTAKAMVASLDEFAEAAVEEAKGIISAD